jgi:RNA methyltransferase, TrmH family
MSLSKNQIKFISALHQKKNREINGLFIVEGDKIASEILQQSKYVINGIYATQDWLEKNKQLSETQKKVCNICSKSDLERISALKTAPEVLFLMKIPKENNSNPSGKINLVLEQIQDPGNMGTIIRTADWFGIENIFCSEDSVELYNPKVLQSSMGSFLRSKIHYTDLDSLLSKNSQIPCYAALLNGKNVYDIAFPQEMFLLIGNEGKGISKNILKHSHIPISIPRFGEAESLNAAVATGILCALIKK